MAQACQCAEEQDNNENETRKANGNPPMQPCSGLSQRLKELRGEIGVNEGTREAQPFVADEPVDLAPGCCDRMAGAFVTDAQIAAKPHYGTGAECKEGGIEFSFGGGAGCLHVWGRGLDQWHSIGGEDSTVSFPALSSPMHGQHFVQLFAATGNCEEPDKRGEPLTAAASLDTDAAHCLLRVELVDRKLAQGPRAAARSR